MSSDLVSLGSNLGFIDTLYESYLEDPRSVDTSWRDLFDGRGPSTANPAPPSMPPASGDSGPESTRPRAVTTSQSLHRDAAATDSGGLSVWPLVNAYRVRGHLSAKLDPLDMLERPRTIELEPETYGFTEPDYDRVFPTAGLHGVERATLREILGRLQATYSASIGVQFMHISAPLKKAWIADRMEQMHSFYPIDDDTKREMLRLLVAAESFERFCHVKYPGTKRFSLEGGESLIPLIDLTLTHAARLGAIEAVMGMAHRGRLNVLTHIMGRKPRDFFTEFEDIEPEASLGGGDVKYHLGYSYDRQDRHGRQIHLSLAFNPSHLEAIDPVVVGRVRAKQRRHGDWEHKQVVGILLHGDAAFAGQGLVPETLNLTNLHGYRTGGTVHVIVNNQIGFTASPRESRSTPYCTDVAKMIEVPSFHVNGEDLDAVARTVQLAMEYRAQFKSDVILDMYCYRQFGHNEMDEPAFTQPKMYERIRQKKPITEIYGGRLIEQGVVTREDIEAMRAAERARLDEEFELGRSAGKRPRVAAMRGIWSVYKGGLESEAPDVDTGVAKERLVEITERMLTLPPGFTPHRKIKRLLSQRRAMGHGESPINWGMAELLAYGSLVWQGNHVRITGQDSCRGTFSHRHATVTDIESGTEHHLLSQLHPEQGYFRIYDSPLSEAGVLGFEFGYSLDFPDALVIWEAQFGDFANGAQVIFDQFIFASEDKWNRLSGLTVFLPHGYEGQGPEHSSARIERFLQGAAEDNMQICQPTTAAQIFHLLRRQMVRPWRKPLIVFTPKSLLRLPQAASDLEELTSGRFQRVLSDTGAPGLDGVDRVMLCSGKLYYELTKERERRGDTRTLILRVEQLYPWPQQAIEAALQPYPGVREIVWVQDEPGNMGALAFVAPKLQGLRDGFRTVCRLDSASPATGSHKAHVMEHETLMSDAFAD